jgi:hypothetical protein
MVRVLEDDPWLCAAARLYFGGWHNTMEAAGLTVTSRKRWPRKRIIAAIDAHQRQGSLRYVWRDDKRLFWAASLRFGNWQNALKAAGFTPKRYQWWSRERIVQELHHKNRQSQYNISIIDRPLAAAAVRLFGGLRLAWEAAGIEPKDRRWTKRRIIEAIQDRYVQGLSLTGKGFGSSVVGPTPWRPLPFPYGGNANDIGKVDQAASNRGDPGSPSPGEAVDVDLARE